MEALKSIFMSFSGGRTSAFMCKYILTHKKFASSNKLFVFANTGKEAPETLDFVDKVDKAWGLGLIWVEAKINPEKGAGTGFKVVSYETASRKGEPFEAMIKKYGLPNINQPHCTRELKIVPMHKYAKEYFKGESYWTVQGIRADEPHRINLARAAEKRYFYPLLDMPFLDSLFIRKWWAKQDFDLELKDYQGNCDLCWKKSNRKKKTIIAERPQIADWWEIMEDKYGKGKYLFDHRTGLSILELIEQSKRPFSRWVDELDADHRKPKLFHDPIDDFELNCFCS